MTDIENELLEKYGGKLRIRVCGVWVEGSEILLAHHKALGPTGSLWIPPGGGVEFGESAEEALKREFLEETGLEIEVHELIFVHEFLNPSFHALELFFKVTGNRRELKTGTDPEMNADSQIITEVTFLNLKTLKKQEPQNLHYILRQIEEPSEIFNLKGYFKSH